MARRRTFTSQTRPARLGPFAGKTGTAQKFVEGAYSHTQFVSSFIGFMPAEDPAFVCLVMVDNRRRRSITGLRSPAPVFANVAKQVAQIMNIPTDIPPRRRRSRLWPAPNPRGPNCEAFRYSQGRGDELDRGPVDRAIHALRYDSRRVEANDVFFAWKGAKSDGHQYIAEVCDKGAARWCWRTATLPGIAGRRSSR